VYVLAAVSVFAVLLAAALWFLIGRAARAHEPPAPRLSSASAP